MQSHTAARQRINYLDKWSVSRPATAPREVRECWVEDAVRPAATVRELKKSRTTQPSLFMEDVENESGDSPSRVQQSPAEQVRALRVDRFATSSFYAQPIDETALPSCLAASPKELPAASANAAALMQRVVTSCFNYIAASTHVPQPGADAIRIRVRNLHSRSGNPNPGPHSSQAEIAKDCPSQGWAPDVGVATRDAESPSGCAAEQLSRASDLPCCMLLTSPLRAQLGPEADCYHNTLGTSYDGPPHAYCTIRA